MTNPTLFSIFLTDILIANGASTETLDTQYSLTPLQFTLDLLAKSSSRSYSVKLTEVVVSLLHFSQLDVTNLGVQSTSPLQLAILTSQPTIILGIISKGSSQLAHGDVQVALEMMDSKFNGPDDIKHQIVHALRSLNSKKGSALQELPTITDVVHESCSGIQSTINNFPCSGKTARSLPDRQNSCESSRAQAHLYLALF